MGYPIFLVILFLVFHLTFAEDFLFLGAGGVFDKTAAAYIQNTQGAFEQVDVTKSTFDETLTYYTEDGIRAELVLRTTDRLKAWKQKLCLHVNASARLS